MSDTLSGALDDALEASGAYALTTGDDGEGLEAHNGFLVLWSNGTDSYLSVAETDTATDNNAVADADLTIHDVAVFKGITDADNIVAGNFDAIL